MQFISVYFLVNSPASSIKIPCQCFGSNVLWLQNYHPRVYSKIAVLL